MDVAFNTHKLFVVFDILSLGFKAPNALKCTRVYFTGLRNRNIGRIDWDRVGIARIEVTIGSQTEGKIVADITIKVAVSFFKT